MAQTLVMEPETGPSQVAAAHGTQGELDLAPAPLIVHAMEDEALKSRLFGYVAEFPRPEPLVKAAKAAHAAGYRKMDGFSPFIVEGLAEAIGKSDLKIPYTMLGAGIAGFVLGFAFLTWTTAFDYPLNIGGRPLIAWPSFIPISYELTILFACLSGIGGMIFLNGLPKPYHPIFNTPGFERATTDRFFLCIEANDPQFDSEGTREFLESLKPLRVSAIGTEE